MFRLWKKKTFVCHSLLSKCILFSSVHCRGTPNENEERSLQILPLEWRCFRVLPLKWWSFRILPLELKQYISRGRPYLLNLVRSHLMYCIKAIQVDTWMCLLYCTVRNTVQNPFIIFNTNTGLDVVLYLFTGIVFTVTSFCTFIRLHNTPWLGTHTQGVNRS